MAANANNTAAIAPGAIDPKPTFHLHTIVATWVIDLSLEEKPELKPSLAGLIIGPPVWKSPVKTEHNKSHTRADHPEVIRHQE